MVTKQEAVRLWEDVVGDSGQAPTDEELHAFALAVHEKSRKPFVKLQAEWERSCKERHSYARNNEIGPPGDPGVISNLATAQAHGYSVFAKKLKNRLEAKN